MIFTSYLFILKLLGMPKKVKKKEKNTIMRNFSAMIVKRNKIEY